MVLLCLETNCFCNVEASKMLHGFNTEWLVAYTNHISENNLIFIITPLKRKMSEINRGGISFHPVTFSTRMARDHQDKNISIKRMSSCLFMAMSDI